MFLKISDKIRDKLTDKHGVTEQEIIECFANRCRESLVDDREEHVTDPPTVWFVSETFYGRKLLILYIQRDECTFIKSAFEPTAGREAFYLANSKLLYPDFDENPNGE